MSSTLLALGAVAIVSGVSLAGAALFLFRRDLAATLPMLIGFASGTLLGATFFDLLPEGAEVLPAAQLFGSVLLGILVFFAIEAALHWHHHGEAGGPHPMTYLNLLGDGVHNFLDGVVIAASFTLDVGLGVVTTIAVIAHEIPQELSDLSILLHGGFSRRRALLWNFVSALTAVGGALVAFALTPLIPALPVILVPFVAGGFIYIAGVDLMPELHRRSREKGTLIRLGLLFVGVALMWYVSMALHEGV